MRILGIDPGTVRMGYGVVEAGRELRALRWGVITSKASLPLHQRLHDLYVGLQEILRCWTPTEVAVEEPFVGSAERRYVQAALAIGQAQAVAFIAAAGLKIPVFRYSPALIKQSVADYGAASKEQVQEMVRALLELKQIPTPSDAADALGVALCHWRQREAQELLAKAGASDDSRG